MLSIVIGLTRFISRPCPKRLTSAISRGPDRRDACVFCERRDGTDRRLDWHVMRLTPGLNRGTTGRRYADSPAPRAAFGFSLKRNPTLDKLVLVRRSTTARPYSFRA